MSTGVYTYRHKEERGRTKTVTKIRNNKMTKIAGIAATLAAFAASAISPEAAETAWTIAEAITQMGEDI